MSYLTLKELYKQDANNVQNKINQLFDIAKNAVDDCFKNRTEITKVKINVMIKQIIELVVNTAAANRKDIDFRVDKTFSDEYLIDVTTTHSSEEHVAIIIKDKDSTSKSNKTIKARFNFSTWLFKNYEIKFFKDWEDIKSCRVNWKNKIVTVNSLKALENILIKLGVDVSGLNKIKPVNICKTVDHLNSQKVDEFNRICSNTINGLIGYLRTLSKCFKMDDYVKEEFDTVVEHFRVELIDKLSSTPTIAMFSEHPSKFFDKVHLSYKMILGRLKRLHPITKYCVTAGLGYIYRRIAYYNRSKFKHDNKIKKIHYENRPRVYTMDIGRIGPEIAYTHILPFYSGKCQYIHGHNGRLDIKMICHNRSLRKRPMLISFHILKTRILQEIHNNLDHKFIWALNSDYPIEIVRKKNSFWTNIKTENLELSIPFTNQAIVLIPPETGLVSNIEKQNFTTSEKIAYNWLVTKVIEILYNIYLKHGINPLEDMDIFREHGMIELTWWESTQTYITVPILL